jgi:hypothetical protein
MVLPIIARPGERRVMERIKELEASEREAKKLCLESAQLIKVQRALIKQMVEALEPAYVELHRSTVCLDGETNPLPRIKAVMIKLKELGYV